MSRCDPFVAPRKDNLEERASPNLVSMVDDARFCAIGYLKIHELYRYNRLFGREKTNDFIRLFANTLKAWIGEKNMLAHITPSKFSFAIFLRSRKALDGYIKELNSVLNNKYCIDNTQVNLTINVGISMFPEDGSNVTSLLEQAESAAKSVSELNLPTIQLYQSKHDAENQLSADLHRELTPQSDSQYINAFYQPQVNFISGQLIGFEALARWSHPEFGELLPGQFIHLAERNHLIHNLDLLIFKNVCKDLRNWIDDKHTVVPISSNFSRTTIIHPNVIDEIRKLMAQYEIPKHLIEIEITESGLYGNLKVMKHQISELRKLGLRIAVDDFGTGLSNLSLVKMLDFDQLKIDRQFVHDVSISKDIASLFLQIKGIADAFGVDYICEGLENQNDLNFLKQIGVGRIQGWLFAKAIERKYIPIILNRFEMSHDEHQQLIQNPLLLRDKFIL